MKLVSRKSVFAAVLLSAAASTMAITAVRAAPVIAGDAAVRAATEANAPSAQRLKLSEEGFSFVRNVQAARIAIFNGNTQSAQKFIDQASTLAKTMTGSSEKFATEIDKVSEGPVTETTHWVAVDGMISVSDDFVATPDKAEHLKQANAHLKAGKHAEAMQTLKLADVDVGFTRLMLPLESAASNLQTAKDLMAKGHFYEANIALKAIQDSLRADTISVFSKA